jgi:hypothetical protein
MITVSKLSKLQRFILAAALRNRTREVRSHDSNGADLYYAEIMVGHFGFEPTTDPRGDHGQHFDLAAIGKRRYAAASAAISRAALRLGTRGLVRCLKGTVSRWSGLSLTSEGSALASAGATEIQKEA